MASLSSARLFPCLWFSADAEEAARFYVSIFPDSRIDHVATMMSESPGGPPGSVKVIDLTLLGERVQAFSSGQHQPFNDAISMVVPCGDQAEIDRYWRALLADGGKEQACGWLTDGFGLRWQIVPAVLYEMMRDTDPVRSRRVTDRLMQMVKLDIAALQDAYDG